MTATPPVTDTTAPPVQRLQGSLGVGAIVFMVVAAAGPLTVVGGAAPVGILLGNGAGYPALFLFLGIVLMLFSVGMNAMSTKIPKAGAFFTYTGYGLSPAWGSAAAWLAMVTYVMVQIAVYGLLGLQTQGLLSSFGVPTIPWWAYTLAMLALVGFLGYNHIDLSSKVLGVLLVAEIGVVIVLSAVIIAQGGATGLNLDSFRPENIFSGDVGIGVMFAAASFIGFESTAIYRDEARDPEKTIPKATYVTVVLITVFYVVATWALIQAWGIAEVANVALATLEAGDMLQQTAIAYIGPWYATAISVLFVTSMFACVLSFHNVLSRYYQSMGKAGLLPKATAHISPTRNAPSRASLMQTAVSAVLIAIFAGVGLDPYVQVFTWFGGVATLAFLVLMVLVSVAVVVYFRRNKVEPSLWKTVIAPVLGSLGILAAAYLVLANFPLLVGDVDGEGNPTVGLLTVFMVGIVVVAPIIGYVQAKYLKAFKKESYSQLLEVLD